MRRLFRISREHWTVWLGVILAIAGTLLTSALSMNAFTAAAAQASSEAKPINLAQPLAVDMAAQQKYLDAQRVAELAKQRAAEAQQQAQTAAAKTAQTTPKATQPAVKTAAAANYDRLIIPKIGLNARLATVGLTADGAVDVNASLPAWFNQSSRPGTSDGVYSAAFIDGHSTGIFRNLGALAVGDQVTVATAGGENYTYGVVKVETRELSDPNLMRAALSTAGGASQGLNLMTCAGTWIGNTYSQRLIIYTTR